MKIRINSMHYPIHLIAILILVSCRESQPVIAEEVQTESKSIRTILKDSLGSVSFEIPRRFDSFFLWTNFSDCGKPCDREQYRFQPKRLPVYKETGFYYRMPDIPMDQFTIFHSGYFPFHDGDTALSQVRHNHFNERLKAEFYHGTIVSDTIARFGDRYFDIACLNGYDTKTQKFNAKVAALTTVKGNEIEFHYDIRSKDTINMQDFYSKSIRYLATIRLSRGI